MASTPVQKKIAGLLGGVVRGGNLPVGLLGSQGSMSSYTPTARERLTALIAKGLFSDSREGFRKAGKVTDIAEMSPVGLLTGMYDAGRAAGGGNMMQAGLIGGMAALPLPPAIKKGIRAYHGSPHSFDKFSMDKIGTGEGAQAYGHGLYFAEGEGVAKSYRDTLTKGQAYGPEATAHEFVKIAGGDTGQAKAKLADGIKNMDARIAETSGNVQADWIKRRQEYADALGMVDSLNKGHMYEVNIDADPDQFLDWDKPLSEQPESIKKAYESYLTTPAARRADKSLGGAIARKEGQFADPTGKDFYGAIYEATPAIGTPERAKVTKTLQQAGIPGIKYLDAGSRAKGDGSRNYVVFDEKLISIVRKYGIAGASALLGYDLLSNVTTEQGEKLKQAERVY